MALASRKSGDIHGKTGGDLTKLKDKYDESNLDLISDNPDDDQILSALLYQMQLLREDIDELRRYVASNEVLTTSAIGGALPTSGKGLASGTLWNNRGIITIA